MAAPSAYPFFLSHLLLWPFRASAVCSAPWRWSGCCVWVGWPESWTTTWSTGLRFWSCWSVCSGWWPTGWPASGKYLLTEDHFLRLLMMLLHSPSTSSSSLFAVMVFLSQCSHVDGPVCDWQVQHWGLWGHRWGHQHHQDGQLALPAGHQHWIAVSLQRQRLRSMGGGSRQGLPLHHFFVFHHDQPDNHWIWQHRPHHGRREDLFCGHDDGWM